MTIPGASYVNLYVRVDKTPFDKMATFFNNYLKD